MKSTIPPMSVRTKILIIFLVLSVVSLFITGFAAFYTIGDMGKSAEVRSAALGKEAIRDSTAALQDVTEENMLRVASDQAQLIDEIFWSTEAELDILAAHAQSVQNNPSYQSQIRAYPVADPPKDPRAGILVLLVPGSAVRETDAEYQALAGMDDLLAAVYRTDGDLTSVYIATDSGILRMYPGYADIGQTFDPRTRPWYTAAKQSDTPVWTEPYVDASGNGLVLTCARSVQTRYGTWVVASDVTTDQLNSYTNLTLGGKGYTVLMDSKGNILSRPGLSSNGTRWDEPYSAENVFASSDPTLVAVGRNMTAGKTGLGRVKFNGVDTIIAYAPIESLNWSYAVSIPQSQVVAPIVATESRIVASTIEAERDINNQTDRILTVFFLLFCLLLIVVIILSVLLARMITRPVDALKAGTIAIGSGDLNFRLDISSGDEFEDLARSFNRMAADLVASIENLKITMADKERYAKEMEIAREIQVGFLPESVPQLEGYEIAAVNIPAMEIGGDLYDFITVGQTRLGFVIADVSGKGTSAALYMALSRTLLHVCGEAEPDPSRAVRNANRLIFEDGRSSMFITVFYGILSPQERTFSYVNAGHNPPLLVREDGTAHWMDNAKGIALGVVPDVSIVPATMDLHAGDVLVLYTDGITEAFNEGDAYFGEERLTECVCRNRSRPAKEILKAVLDEIRLFTGTAPQSDDITLVIIHVL